ncbi:hypothetical protein Poli38472_001051 [Pythium oligandrum]|uniref:Carbohydrate kinase FGGY N-terminal domain-containing protein n=1 Tax=Pythium oligandrum TaxID=41045 RepID=A0A8K1FM27_PYTOL|nr:hypothetical protein Poli38472_001051 [Pythium oligandrum]|eukprot:TMW68895.1 hypothetical protein Poli38472_001051 [Pythium oligandrum]
MTGYLLGVDVGTTAVKCALVESSTRDVVATTNVSTKSGVDCGAGRAEQAVEAILMATKEAIDGLPRDILGKISSIGICGQMHGIVWWKAAEVGRAASLLMEGSSTSEAAAPWSRLITWEDQRCSRTFLDEVDAKIKAAISTEGSSLLSSGYGLASYAHMLSMSPERLEGFDSCGTIHDLLAFLLCGYTSATDATMDTTNAFSWGGFDIDKKTWNATAVKALGISVELLPAVKTPGTIVGRIPETSIFKLPSDAPVYVPMGDHPCSVVSAIVQQDSDTSDGVTLVNIGTSAQLAMLLPAGGHDNTQSSTRGFEFRPFVNEHQLLGVAAALSGGNMFAWLVERCQEWMQELTGDASISQSLVYERLIARGLDKRDTTLVFRPTLNGERSNSQQTGFIDLLLLHNGSLGDLSAALSKGLIQNLVEMAPEHLQEQLRTSRMIGTGNALLRNKLLQHFLQQQLDDPLLLALQDAADAAVGAALVPVFLNLGK